MVPLNNKLIRSKGECRWSVTVTVGTGGGGARRDAGLGARAPEPRSASRSLCDLGTRTWLCRVSASVLSFVPWRSRVIYCRGLKADVRKALGMGLGPWRVLGEWRLLIFVALRPSLRRGGSASCTQERNEAFFFLDDSLGAWTPAVCVRVCARAHSDALL